MSNLESPSQSQPYDSMLKALLGDEASEIIPNLLPGAELLGVPSDEERNIEINRSTLKADLVFRIRYKREPAILNLELQTEADADMERRLLQYHAGLHAKHKVPILSVVIYPFQCNVRRPPYEEKCGDEIFLTFHPKVVCLWELDAQPIVRDHILSLYVLLPTMKGAEANLLSQALKEMAQRYTRQQLDNRVIWFGWIMRRSTTMSDEDKQIVEEELRMQYHYDELIDTNPLVLERVARGEARGEARGKIEGLREAIIKILGKRFPALQAQVRQTIASIQDAKMLEELIDQLLVASDEREASTLLNLPADRG